MAASSSQTQHSASTQSSSNSNSKMGSMGNDYLLPDRKWWKDGTVYQIYPASFMDSNGDGIGDIPGITSKLDYIQGLGVDVVWVCPMYDSPQVDMGYDISDYESVYPPYGTVDDMQTLIDEVHRRGMRIILDLVINHTSDQHKWFQESRSSKDNPKRDWYIWRPAKYDKDGNRMPPNNWRAVFQGSAWQWDEHTQEYYLHLFAVEQPDLNWENEETRKAIYQSAMEFWLKKGVDGFRVDTVNMYSKGDMPDAPITEPGRETQNGGMVWCNGPRMDEFLEEMHTVLEKYDAMTVGECPHTPDMKRVINYVSAEKKRLNMVFQFDVAEIGTSPDNKFATSLADGWLVEFKAALARTQRIICGTDAWTTAFLENHDWSRSISRYGCKDPQFRAATGKMLAMMLGALSGTLFVYQGQELGMVNIPTSWPIEEYKDLDALNYYNEVAKDTNNDPAALEATRLAINFIGRDNARTPMQWSSDKNAGFSTGKPWMRVHDEYPKMNVALEEKDSGSVLSYWKRVLQLRNQYHDLFVYGEFEIAGDEKDKNVFMYTKSWHNRKALVVLNFTSEKQSREIDADLGEMKLLESTAGSSGGDLLPYEGRIYLST